MLDIEHSAAGPFIKFAEWNATGENIFTEKQLSTDGLDWLQGNPLYRKVRKKAKFRIEEDSIFQTAYITQKLSGLDVTWQISVSRQFPLLSYSMSLSNTSRQTINIDKFQVWESLWDNPSGSGTLKWWKALTYEPVQQKYSEGQNLHLFSDMYSSERSGTEGDVPYWIIEKDDFKCLFALNWSGGWRFDLRQGAETTDLNVYLPPEETQLTLLPGEKINGPVLEITLLKKTDEAADRKQWLDIRNELAHAKYSMPESIFPFIYNHWYSVRFNLTEKFIKDQIKSMAPYEFDVFVVDAGWYESVGKWQPHPDKFKPGEFEGALKFVRDNGLIPGLWSCPQLVVADTNNMPPEVDQPGRYVPFMKAYLLDLAGHDFKSKLLEHISQLRNDYYMDWWKYDQDFFATESREGKMKNVIAFQEALTAVRNAHPDLFIEGCMSGGRMINELTNSICQIHLIRDGNRNGLEHARTNISEALGAANFLPLEKIERWTNRPDELQDPELLRMYCRSCMIGVWGVSADMSLLKTWQRDIIIKESFHYRKLNEIKAHGIFEIIRPSNEEDCTGVVFYNTEKEQAAIIFYRGNNKGNISQNIKLNLRSNTIYEVSSTDKEQLIDFKNTRNNVFNISLTQNQLSKILFLRIKE